MFWFKALSAPFSWAFRSWVLVVLWGWYVTPAYGIATPSLAQAFGVIILAQLLCKKSSMHGYRVQSDDERRFEDRLNLVLSWLTPAVALAFGWVGSVFL